MQKRFKTADAEGLHGSKASEAVASPVKHRRIYVARHGIKEDNTSSKDNFDLKLLPAGLQALDELSAFFEAHEVRFGAVLCSPFFRCRQTAEALLSSRFLYSIKCPMSLYGFQPIIIMLY